MAISVSVSTIPSLNARESCKPSASYCKSSSLTAVRLAGRLHGFRIDPRKLPLSSKPRYVPLAIKAKMQTYSTFDDLLANADRPVLVDFYATWCGPCQFMVPILKEVSAAMNDTIQVVKIDTEKYPSIANKYRIEALPTFILFKDGKPCDRFEGAMGADQLIERIESSLKAKQQ